MGDCAGLDTEFAAAGTGAVKGTPDGAGRFEPKGALVPAGGGDVASEAVVNPEWVFADPDGMPAAPTAGRSASTGAGIATSGGGPAEAGAGSDAVALRGTLLIPRAVPTRTAA